MGLSVQNILKALKEYDQTSDSVGMELRLDLAEIVLRSLRLKKWTQRDLATRAGVKESFVSRVVHSNANCTFETAGRLLFALGVRACLREAPSTETYMTPIGEVAAPKCWLSAESEETYGQNIPQEVSTTDQPEVRIIQEETICP